MAYFRVSCRYMANRYPAFDNKLETVVVRKSTGSGMGVGLRDMSWTWSKLTPAQNAFVKLNKIRNILDLTLEKE